MEEEELPNKGGRPTKYDPANNEIVTNYCLMGATDTELATFLDVCEATINNWKKDYPEFLESIKKGKELADARVAGSMYKKATGYTAKHKKAVKIREGLGGGKYIEKVVMVEEEQEIPPDATLAIFWSKNRRPNDWRDKKDVEVKVDKQVFKIGDQEFEI